MAAIVYMATYRLALGIVLCGLVVPSYVWSKDPCTLAIELMAFGNDSPLAAQNELEASRAFVGKFIQILEHEVPKLSIPPLTRQHLKDLLANPLEGRVRAAIEDVGAVAMGPLIRNLNEVLAVVQAKLKSSTRFVIARESFVREFPAAIEAYLVGIERRSIKAASNIVEAGAIRQSRVIAVGNWVNSIVVDPEGNRIASGGDDGILRQFERGTGRLIHGHSANSGHLHAVSYSPDGRYLASGGMDGIVRIWLAETQMEIAALKGHLGGVFSVNFSPDGRYLVSGGEDTTVRIWDIATKLEVARFERHTMRVKAATFSPDGKRVASGGEDEIGLIWDVASQRKLVELTGHRDWISSLTFNPDGKLIATASGDRTVRIWDSVTGKARERQMRHATWVNSVNFSPDGTLVVSGDHHGTVHIWDVATAQVMHKYHPHVGAVRSLSFNLHDGTIVSGGDETRIHIQLIPARYIPDSAEMNKLVEMRAAWLEDLKKHPIVFEKPDQDSSDHANPVGVP